ncbi:MAG: HD domain-containing protein [Clostridia bacterium]|nr:HD domain-containing protein [Clostridia bacterium]
MLDKYRLNHSFAVANKMIEIGKKFKLGESELQDLFILGYNHDIGYEFSIDKTEHNIIGGQILKNNGYKYWKEVYYHGNPNAEYNSLFLKILNMADMQIDKYGNDVGFDKRLEDIKNRYGEDSIQYINAKSVIDSLM